NNKTCCLVCITAAKPWPTSNNVNQTSADFGVGGTYKISGNTQMQPTARPGNPRGNNKIRIPITVAIKIQTVGIAVCHAAILSDAISVKIGHNKFNDVTANLRIKAPRKG